MNNEKKCLYCGSQNNLTNEHIPGRGFFPKPKPDNLISVISCEDCNSSFKKDEDVFVAWINFGDAGESEGGKEMWDKLNRTYNKDKGVKRIIARSFKQVNVVSEAGIWLRKGITIEIERERLHNVLKKIVLGLYYLEYEEPLNPLTPLEHYHIQKQTLLEDFEKLAHIPGKYKWDKFFRYSYNRMEDKKDISVWMLEFYNRTFFALITGKDAS